MAAGRGPHDSDAVRSDIPFLGMLANKADGLLGVAQRYFIMAVRHAVFQYNISDTLGIEPGRHVVAFVVHGQTGISTAGAHDDGHAVGLVGFINGNGGFDHIGYPSSLEVLFCPGQAVAVGRSGGPEWKFKRILCR